MHHALPVAVGEAVEDLARDVPRVGAVVQAHFLQPQRERLALDQLHHDAGELVGLDEVVDRRHARVVDAPGDLGLAPEARERAPELHLVQGALGDHLERHRALDALVEAAVHRAGGALAEQLAHLVAADAIGNVHADAPWFAASAASSAGGFTGRVTVKVVPTSTCERTSMCPPCCETIL